MHGICNQNIHVFCFSILRLQQRQCQNRLTHRLYNQKIHGVFCFVFQAPGAPPEVVPEPPKEEPAPGGPDGKTSRPGSKTGSRPGEPLTAQSSQLPLPGRGYISSVVAEHLSRDWRSQVWSSEAAEGERRGRSKLSALTLIWLFVNKLMLMSYYSMCCLSSWSAYPVRRNIPLLWTDLKFKIFCRLQTLKRLKRALFIMTKHSLRIFGVFPFFEPQNNTEKWH